MSRVDLPLGSIAQLALAGVAVAMLVRPKLLSDRRCRPLRLADVATASFFMRPFVRIAELTQSACRSSA